MEDRGVHTVAQLVAAGVARSTISRRCRSGRWTRLLPGVVATGEVGTLELCRAVVLWQPRVVLSHRTAAWLWDLVEPPSTIEATVPRTANVRCPEWLALHRRRLAPALVTVRRGLPVVTVERTVLDCGTGLAPAAADLVTDTALADGLPWSSLVTLGVVDAGVSGVVELRRQAREAAVGARSEPERVVARALARRGWRLRANVSVRQWLCDLVDEASATVIEIDGREVHSLPDVFRRDRRRQNDLLRTHHVLRYAAADALADPDAVADAIIGVLRRRRAARR
jgi:very-short-patch-repair endonuclease